MDNTRRIRRNSSNKISTYNFTSAVMVPIILIRVTNAVRRAFRRMYFSIHKATCAYIYFCNQPVASTCCCAYVYRLLRCYYWVLPSTAHTAEAEPCWPDGRRQSQSAMSIDSTPRRDADLAIDCAIDMTIAICRSVHVYTGTRMSPLVSATKATLHYT